MTHPRYGVRKTYRVVVAGRPERDVLKKLLQGVHLAEGATPPPSGSRPSRPTRIAPLLELVFREGKNREIRRILARVGHKVLRLTRVAVGAGAAGHAPQWRIPAAPSTEEVTAPRHEGRSLTRLE